MAHSMAMELPRNQRGTMASLRTSFATDSVVPPSTAAGRAASPQMHSISIVRVCHSPGEGADPIIALTCLMPGASRMVSHRDWMHISVQSHRYRLLPGRPSTEFPYYRFSLGCMADFCKACSGAPLLCFVGGLQQFVLQVGAAACALRPVTFEEPPMLIEDLSNPNAVRVCLWYAVHRSAGLQANHLSI